MGYAKQGQNTGGENDFNQDEEQILPEIFGTKRLAKKYTWLGTCINCQLNKDQIQLLRNVPKMSIPHPDCDINASEFLKFMVVFIRNTHKTVFKSIYY